jgi:ribosomal peptide maturation radical SAM protein 1
MNQSIQTGSTSSNQEVCLVQMPYGPLKQPRLGLSILKATLENTKITASVFYANLLWAEEIGVYIYNHISDSERYNLVAEWTFSESAFPDFQPDHDEYFHHVQISVQRLEKLLARLDESHKNAQTLLWEIREKTKAFINDVAHEILSKQPRIVGCTSMFQQHCASLALLNKIKALNPDIVTMMGGANCEASMGVVAHQKCRWVDFVVSGEADLIFPKLCEQILLSGPDLTLQELPEGVLGPIHRRHGGYALVEKYPPRAKVIDMKNSPMPDHDDYFNQLQVSSIGDMIIPAIPIETSRGCWWGEVSHCAFCGIQGDNMSYRSKAPNRVIEELEYLSQRYQTKNFFVVDSILDMQYFKTVIPTLAEQQKGYNIFYDTKANLKHEHLQKMAEAGIRWIEAGIECLDDTLLKKIGKGSTVHQNIQLMKWAREMGIFNCWQMLYDIPGETDDIYLKLLEWLPNISHLQPPSNLWFFEYHRFSPVHRQPALFGLKLSPHRSYYYVYPWDEQALENFAYYFYDDRKEQRPIYLLYDNRELQRPGLRALRESIKSWQREWGAEGLIHNQPKNGFEPATLVMIDDGEQIEITDTRACAIQAKFRLNGLYRQIYHICDKAHKPEGILRILHLTYNINCTWDTIEPIVQLLCEQKLLLRLNGYFLSLAVRGPLKSMPSLADSPSGGIKSLAYAKTRTHRLTPSQ